MNSLIELTEITITGFLFWKKEKREVIILSVEKIESLRNRKRTGTVIETETSSIEVMESMLEIHIAINIAYIKPTGITFKSEQ